MNYTKKRFSIQQVVNVVNKFSSKEVSENEILDFLIEEKPNFAKIDIKEKIIFATDFDMMTRQDELVEWSKRGWIVTQLMFQDNEY